MFDQASGTPTRGGASATPVDLEAGPSPAAIQPADATDKHMEEFFKEVTGIKVYLDRTKTVSPAYAPTSVTCTVSAGCQLKRDVASCMSRAWHGIAWHGS